MNSRRGKVARSRCLNGVGVKASASLDGIDMGSGGAMSDALVGGHPLDGP